MEYRTQLPIGELAYINNNLPISLDSLAIRTLSSRYLVVALSCVTRPPAALPLVAVVVVVAEVVIVEPREEEDEEASNAERSVAS
jgi:hypothetical protein